MNLAAFRSAVPEFQTAGDTLVQSRLDQAALRMDLGVWGTRFDEGHGLLAAHLLALSPYGQMARMVSEKGATTYGTQFDTLTRIVAGLAYRVIG